MGVAQDDYNSIEIDDNESTDGPNKGNKRRSISINIT